MSESAHCRHLTFSPKRVSASVDRTRLEDDDFTERVLFLEGSRGGVTLAMEGSGDGPVGGALAEVDAEQARQLADALTDAADELEAEA